MAQEPFLFSIQSKILKNKYTLNHNIGKEIPSLLIVALTSLQDPEKVQSIQTVINLGKSQEEITSR